MDFLLYPAKNFRGRDVKCARKALGFTTESNHNGYAIPCHLLNQILLLSVISTFSPEVTIIHRYSEDSDRICQNLAGSSGIL